MTIFEYANLFCQGDIDKAVYQLAVIGLNKINDEETMINELAEREKK